MSQMLVEIDRIVNEDISNRITQYEVLFEAITNSIQANASQIDVSFSSSDNILKDVTTGAEMVDKKVDEITIKDNGDGFSKANYLSFCKYRTNHKMTLGCKGIGRFAFLKVYDRAIYSSDVKGEQKNKAFTFLRKFETDNVIELEKKVLENSTILVLAGINHGYLNALQNIDRRISLDLNYIREIVLYHLIPTLFFYKKKMDREIEIRFIDTSTGESVMIIPNDIPDLSESNFSVLGKDGNSKHFILYYQIINEAGDLHAYYCGNNRTVTEFSKQDFKISFPENYSGYLLVEGQYLDENVNNERNDFNIYPIKTDAYLTVSWEMINDSLKNVIGNIAKEMISETESINKAKLKAIQDERPYLMEYIDPSDLNTAAFIDKKTIIEKAKKKFDSAKENFIASSGKENYNDKDLQDAIQITQNELVAYIYDRVQVIERLKTMLGDKEKVEAVIHNLFMKKHTDDTYFATGKNNLWLLDDRFTTYSYAASDKRIKDVLKSIGEKVDDQSFAEDKPDLSIFFSHNPLQPERLKSVLIEIKPFDYDSKSGRKKFAGIQQLLDYVEAFKEKENIEEIFAFLITDIDADLSARLKKDDYIPLFSLDSPIYHRFYKEAGTSIYVISAETLIKDAEGRNKIFLDIIKSQSRLSEILNK